MTQSFQAFLNAMGEWPWETIATFLAVAVAFMAMRRQVKGDRRRNGRTALARVDRSLTSVQHSIHNLLRDPELLEDKKNKDKFVIVSRNFLSQLRTAGLECDDYTLLALLDYIDREFRVLADEIRVAQNTPLHTKVIRLCLNSVTEATVRFLGAGEFIYSEHYGRRAIVNRFIMHRKIERAERGYHLSYKYQRPPWWERVLPEKISYKLRRRRVLGSCTVKGEDLFGFGDN